MAGECGGRPGAARLRIYSLFDRLVLGGLQALALAGTATLPDKPYICRVCKHSPIATLALASSVSSYPPPTPCTAWRPEGATGMAVEIDLCWTATGAVPKGGYLGEDAQRAFLLFETCKYTRGVRVLGRSLMDCSRSVWSLHA